MTGNSAQCSCDRALISAVAAMLFVFFLVAPASAQDAACSTQTEVVRGEKGARIDAFLLDLAGDGFSGVVLVADRDGILLHRAYGRADREKGVPNTINTRFEIASVSKIFTSAAILQLEMKGELRTDDPLGKHLGTFPAEKAGATIHHLLTHTSGLVRDGAALESSSREAFIRSVKETEIESPPGEKYRYTNAGYSLLAALVEEVSGQTFESYLRKNLFAPAGISCVDFRGEKPAASVTHAIGYASKDNRVAAPIGDYVWGTRGAGGVITTVAELYRWDRALRGTAVLSESAKAKAFAVHVRDEGYGWHLARTSRGTATQFRGGGMPGFESQFVRFPDEDAVIIFPINTRQERFRLPAWRGLEEILFSQP